MKTTTLPPRTDGRGSQLGYVPGLDGLRALAVGAVLLYHAQNSLMPGGFLGVEVFFVISGYLITALLLKEWRQSGRINLPAFWLRRARRLLPALFLLILSVLAFAVIFLPDEVANLRSDALAATAYITNWYFILSNTSYFESVGRPSLLKHLWSLAVEEQFYLLWPPLLAIMLRFWKPRQVVLAVAAGALASVALMIYLYVPLSDPSRVYYGTDTRAAGLLIGAALAFVWSPEKLPARLTGRRLDLIGLGALGVIFWFFLRVNQFQAGLYQGGFAVLSLTTAVLIAVTVAPQSRLGALMGREPLRWIGLRSYGIYLWHWPVYMVTRPTLDVPIDGLPLLALRLTATLVLAELSYRLVETPIRSGALGRAWTTWRATQGRQRWWLGVKWSSLGGAMAICLMALGATVAQAQPPPPPDYLAIQSVNTIGSSASPTVEIVAPTATTEATATATDTPLPTITPTTTPTTTALAQSTVVPPAAATVTVIAPTPTLVPPTPAPPTATPTSTAIPPTATPSPTPMPTCVAVTGGRVTAIGDSVMIGAVDDLRQVICNIEIDAVQGRLVPFAVDTLRAHAAAGQLGQVVVIHVGNNGVFYASQFDQMMAILADAKRVVFLNDRVAREWEAPNNVVLGDSVKRYPNAVLVDWHGITANRPDLFWQDGMHLRPEGSMFYAALIAAAIKGF